MVLPPVPLTIKVPLGVWILALLAAFLGLARRGYGAAWRDELTILAPAVVVLALVSSQTGFNHHSRYVLPIFPFFFVWMSKAARAFERKVALDGRAGRRGRGRAVASSLWVYPHSLSYFNELAGAPANGHNHLLDSNIDWGQDILYLRDWLKDHPERGRCTWLTSAISTRGRPGSSFRCRQESDESRRGFPAGRRELGPHPGWYAVSVAMLRGCEFGIPDGKGGFPWMPLNSFSYFQRFWPVGRAGWSIYIYHITPEECRQARREMGLPVLEVPANAPGSKN